MQHGEITDIHLPKNSPLGIFIAGAAFLVGFGLIWHIWWLALLGLVGAICLIVIRSLDEETEYTIPAKEVIKLETALQKRKLTA